MDNVSVLLQREIFPLQSELTTTCDARLTALHALLDSEFTFSVGCLPPMDVGDNGRSIGFDQKVRGQLLERREAVRVAIARVCEAIALPLAEDEVTAEIKAIYRAIPALPKGTSGPRRSHPWPTSESALLKSLEATP